MIPPHTPAQRLRELSFAMMILALGLLVGTAALAQTSAPGPLKPENELLLDVRLDGRSLGNAILGYQGEETFWLSLSELVDVLQFPINVDGASGRAGGWYVDEENRFALDLNAGEVESAGDIFDINARAQGLGGDIFVTVQALEQWFPVRLSPEIRKLALLVETTETIPLQARLSRRDSRAFSGAGSVGREPTLPFQETPYDWLGPHATDVRLNLSSILEDEDDTSTSLGGSYSVLSRGDLVWMTSTIAVTGSKDEEVSNVRFKLERDDINGPLALEYLEVGDVDAGARGVLVRGGGAQEGLTGLFSDEQVDLRGDIPPDWEVELYRNGVLIDFQVVGADAQYEFLDVPLEFGENRFEFVLYGPFGEQRREEKVYYAGRSNLAFGEVSYELAAVQDGRTVFDVQNGARRGDVDTGRFLADFNFGLSSRAVASFGVDSFVFNDQREQDFSAGLSLNFARLQTSLGYEDLSLSQDEATGLVRARLGEQTTTSLRYTHYVEGDVPEERLSSDREEWDANVGLATRVGPVPLNIDAIHQERTESRDTAASVGTTVPVGDGVRLSKSFFYDRTEQASGTDERTGGTVNVSTGMRPWRFRAGVGYEISPETEVSSVNASANLRVDSNMTMNFDVTHSARIDYTTYRAGFNWLLDYLQVSPQIIYDSNERWIGLLSLSTSFNPRPGNAWPAVDRLSQTSYGSVHARAFLDENGNGVMDGNEQGVEGARVDALQAWRTAHTRADGSAYLTRLRNNRVTDVAIDPASLPDIDMTPASPGVSVKPRPGSWSEVNFPVIRTMELEGHVYTRTDSDADREPLARAPVQLLNASGTVVSSQRTAFDGFFLFANVPPGRYQLALGDGLMARVEKAPEEVRVTAEGGIQRELDFILNPPSQRQLAPVAEPERERAPFAPSSPAPSLAETAAAAEPEAPEDQEPEPAPQGRWFVQLGAFGERANAQRYWDQLTADGIVPQRARPRFEPRGSLTRLLAGPGQTEAGARGLCQLIQAEGADCLVREVAE